MDYKIKSRIWFEANNHVLLGKGKVSLLKAIEETGSLSKAAKSVKISYKKAWSLIDDVNKTAAKPVITASVGGKGGGGTQLTPYGKKLVTLFEEINTACIQFLENQITKLNHL